MISKEQQRSEFALKRIQSLETVDKDLANFIVGTPTMILQNGFGQTLAFLLSKCKGTHKETDKHYFTFKTITGWSNRTNPAVPGTEKEFFETISKLDQSDYLTLQEEALRMLQWLKRYAKAFQEEK